MGEETRADVVSMRVSDGDRVQIEGISLQALYTPGHTDDSYSFVMPGQAFTGDTLLIRGTGRTDFQNGDPRAQYESLFGKLLRLPDETLVYPAHDYKGDTVSTIGEERRHNPRLRVSSVDEYADMMNHLNLPNPKMMDVAVPANLHIGMPQEDDVRHDSNITPTDAMRLLGDPEVRLVDLRERPEREKHGVIANSLHVSYPDLADSLRPGGLLHELAAGDRQRLLFVCAFGERSAMAVKAAREAGFLSACHLQGGIAAWRAAKAPLTSLSE
jgi:rhodanese-related sulfurtransferase